MIAFLLGWREIHRGISFRDLLERTRLLQTHSIPHRTKTVRSGDLPGHSPAGPAGPAALFFIYVKKQDVERARRLLRLPAGPQGHLWRA